MNEAFATLLRPSISSYLWASPGQPGQTLDDLVKVMQDMGNDIVAIDPYNNCLLLSTSNEPGEPVWACRTCYEQEIGVNVFTEEKELMEHYAEDHRDVPSP